MTTRDRHRIEIRNVFKNYGDITALNGVDLSIPADGIFGLLGPNGAGKTTLISTIIGLVELDSGEILVDNQKHNPASYEFKRKLGIVPQELAIYDDLSANANLKFFGSLFGLKGKYLSDHANYLLKVTGLSDRANDRVKTFSGGMKRRLNLACGIIHRPEIVMMDEPTVGIDPQSRNLIYELVESLANDGMTILYTTHYMDEAERLCGQIAIIDQGKIIAKGTLSQLIDILGESDIITFEIRGNADIKKLENVVDEGSVELKENLLIIQTLHGSEKLSDIMQSITSGDCEIVSTTIRKPNLEHVFLHLTGKGLRD
ncbi:MAG: ABC transporter ATP-binding protein [bacterium]